MDLVKALSAAERYKTAKRQLRARCGVDVVPDSVASLAGLADADVELKELEAARNVFRDAVDPELFTELYRMVEWHNKALVAWRDWARRGHEELDADNDMKALKILMALAGRNRGYDDAIDAGHDAISAFKGTAQEQGEAK